LQFDAELAWRQAKGLGKATRKLELVRETAPISDRFDAEVGACQQGDGELELHQSAYTHRRKIQFMVKNAA